MARQLDGRRVAILAPDRLRTDPRAVAFVRSFFDAGLTGGARR